MATNLFKVLRANPANGLSFPAVAPAPSGGTIVAAPHSGSSGYVQIARFDSSGAHVWRFRIDSQPAIAGSFPYVYVAANATRVLVQIISSEMSLHYLDIADGTEIWKTRLPIRNTEPVLGISPDGTRVYVAGRDSGNTQARLVSLAATDGAKQWEFDLRAGIGAGTSYALDFMSGGDVVVAATANNADTGLILYRITSAGALTWGRTVSFSGASVGAATIGVDPSDNIYVVGRSFDTNADSERELPLAKIDSGGTLIWGRMVRRPSASPIKYWRYQWVTPLVATADGVYLACALTDGTVLDGAGHVFVASAGTVGAGVVKIAHYNAPGSANPVPVAQKAGSQILMAHGDAENNSGAPFYAVIIQSDNTGASDDGNFGSIYERTTYEYDLESRTVTVAASPSRTPSGTVVAVPAAQTTSYTAGDMETETFVPSTICNATGRASTLAFGLPVLQGLQLPYTRSTAFGAARSGRGMYASSLVNSQQFGAAVARPSYRVTAVSPATALGTPQVLFNRTVFATGAPSEVQFDVPFAVQGSLSIGYRARPAASAVAFGRPAAAAQVSAAAQGSSTTLFGAAGLLLSLPATGLASTAAFGAAKIALRAAARGFSSTAYGRPTVVVSAFAVSVAAPARFGTPRVASRRYSTASGFTTTAYGTPSGRPNVRTRSAKFRTVFGNALAERAEP